MSSRRVRRLGVLMDPIAAITPAKDTTLALLLAAQARDWELHYFEQKDLYVRDGHARAQLSPLSVKDDPKHWHQLGPNVDTPLTSLDVVLMRKDPPFDMEYVYTTYLLERAETEGVLVVNRPQSLRDVNEKAYTAWFAACSPPTLITRGATELRGFLAEHGKIVVKPLDGMGGRSIFVVDRDDLNQNVIFETITEHGERYAMAQKFIPEISVDGDKRILLVDGEPIPYALARIPAKGESRGNLAAGAKGEGRKLTTRDRWICEQVAPVLREKGLLFVGLDVIGDYLTEINVTSPTGLRELDRTFGLDIGAQFIDVLETKIAV